MSGGGYEGGNADTETAAGPTTLERAKKAEDALHIQGGRLVRTTCLVFFILAFRTAYSAGSLSRYPAM